MHRPPWRWRGGPRPRLAVIVALLALAVSFGTASVWHALGTPGSLPARQHVVALREAHALQREAEALGALLALVPVAGHPDEIVRRLRVASEQLSLRLAHRSVPGSRPLAIEVAALNDAIIRLARRGGGMAPDALAPLSGRWEWIARHLDEAGTDAAYRADAALLDQDRRLSRLRGGLMAALAALAATLLAGALWLRHAGGSPAGTAGSEPDVEPMPEPIGEARPEPQPPECPPSAREAREATVADAAPVGLWQVDARGRTLYANRAMTELLGLGRTAGRDEPGLADALPDRGLAALLDRLARKQPIEPVRLETELRDAAGGGCRVLVRAVAADHAAGPSLLAAVIRLDGQGGVAGGADHPELRDALTGLTNRAALADRLPALVAQSREQGCRVAVLAVGLDRLKEVNDTLGPRVGDLLLRAAADRLRAAVPAADTVARLSGDGFAVVLPGLASAAEAARLAPGIVAALNGPLELDGQALTMTCRVGLAVSPDHAAHGEQLLRFACLALEHTRREPSAAVTVFSRALSDEMEARRTMEAAFRRALARDELRLAWQPQLALADDRIDGAEALARWYDRLRGREVPPREFIAVAEQSSLILELDAKVLELACRQAVTWSQRLPRPLRASVNLSPALFRRPDLPELVGQALAEIGLPAQLLELEVGELALLENHKTGSAVLRRLHEQGVRLALDHCGTSRADLSYLQDLPLDRLKIDRSFVAGLEHDRRCRSIVRAILELSRRLGVAAIAEGVETAEQLAILREEGCDFAQGYLVERPVPAEDLQAWLAVRARRGDPLSEIAYRPPPRSRSTAAPPAFASIAQP